MTLPAKIGRYEVLDVLGEGAMGVVYKGYDPVIERLVAIKTVRKELADTPLAEQAVARFKNEAKAGGRLVHLNIVGVYEFGEDESNAFIVMEYVEGTRLREYSSRHADFDLRQIFAIMKQLLQALDFAHQRGVIHRDVKPTNLILTADGTLKPADFGIAHIDSSNLTISGTVLGSAERKLAHFVGPMASVMVREAAGRAGDLAELYALLSEKIADPEGRQRFSEADRPTAATVANVGTGVGTRSGSQPVASGPRPTPTPEYSSGADTSTKALAAPLEQAFVDQAAARLAVYLGPIAGWVTKRAALQAGSRQELVRILASQLGAQERRGFLRDIGFPEI